MMFLPRALYLDRDEMAAYIAAIPMTGWRWTPVGITWHNTAEPSLKLWDSWPEPVRAAWGDNYDHYCRFDQRWHSGPHFCGAPERSFVLCEPRRDGVHSTCFNKTHFGVETVGDFHSGSGGEDPKSGRGLMSMWASANIIAALCKRMGWSPHQVVNFHRNCPADHHACPGDLVTDYWALRLVEDRLAALMGMSPAPVSPAPVSFDLSTPAGVREALRAIGYANESVLGAVVAFQAHCGLVQDGIAGPLTKAAILKEVAYIAAGAARAV